MARSKSKGWRLDLGDDLEAKLTDFAAVYYKANKTEIVREAVDLYIKVTLDKEQDRKKRYDAAQEKRRRESG
jgi:hypothetical protein